MMAEEKLDSSRVFGRGPRLCVYPIALAGVGMGKGSKESEGGVLPDQELLAQMGKFNEQLVKAGIMLAGDGLHPTSKGKRVRFSGTKRTVIDGPFTESKELIAGYWMWQV